MIWRLVSCPVEALKSALIRYLISRAAALNWRHNAGPKVNDLLQTLASTNAGRSQYKRTAYMNVKPKPLPPYTRTHTTFKTQFNPTDTELQTWFLCCLPLHITAKSMFVLQCTAQFCFFGVFLILSKHKHKSAIKKWNCVNTTRSRAEWVSERGEFSSICCTFGADLPWPETTSV